MLKVDEIASELDLSEIEVRRAICRGRLIASEISGFDAKTDVTQKPKLRVTQKSLEDFVSSAGFNETQVPANFFNEDGELNHDSAAEDLLREFWTKYVRENQKWATAFRSTFATLESGDASQVKEVRVTHETLPESLIEFSRRNAKDELAKAEPAEDELVDSLKQEAQAEPTDSVAAFSVAFTIAQSIVHNRTRKAIWEVIQEDYGFEVSEKIIVSDVLYSTPAVYQNIISKVVQRVNAELFRSEAIEAKLKADDLSPVTLSFKGFAEFDIRALLPANEHIECIRSAF